MGINNHGFNLLHYASQHAPLGDVLTLGRLGFHVARRQEPRLLRRVGSEYFDKRDAERVMRDFFGAAQIDSMDISDFEGATIRHDLNLPVPESLHGRFDSVIDFGTCEHVYNIVQAFENISKMTKPGGQILHMLPANGQCGHGFWQCSPELFYSLYKPANGYRETEVFIADNAAPLRWLRASKPTEGRRTNLRSATPLFAMVRTVKAEAETSHLNVQQSDYEVAWEGGAHDPKRGSISNSKTATATWIARRSLRLAEILGNAFHYDMIQWQRHSEEVDLRRLKAPKADR